MGSRSTLVAGLLAGMTAAAVMLVAAVLALPEPSPGAAALASPSSATGSPGVSTPPPESAGEPSVEASIVTTTFRIGEPAPALRVPQLGGGQIDLTKLAGQPVWIAFIQTTCGSCAEDIGTMTTSAARYADAGLVVIAIDVREDEAIMTAFVQGHGVTFPIGLDADGAAATAWNAVTLPAHFWIDRDGVVRAAALGGIGPEAMARNLQAILPGIDVTP